MFGVSSEACSDSLTNTQVSFPDVSLLDAETEGGVMTSQEHKEARETGDESDEL